MDEVTTTTMETFFCRETGCNVGVARSNARQQRRRWGCKPVGAGMETPRPASTESWQGPTCGSREVAAGAACRGGPYSRSVRPGMETPGTTRLNARQRRRQGCCKPVEPGMDTPRLAAGESWQGPGRGIRQPAAPIGSSGASAKPTQSTLTPSVARPRTPALNAAVGRTGGAGEVAGLRGRQMLRAASATLLGPHVDCVPWPTYWLSGASPRSCGNA